MSARGRIVPIFIPHAGCPHDCVFCNQREISSCRRPPDPTVVCEIISRCLDVSGEKPEIAFYGGSFTALPLSEQRGFLSSARSFGDRISGIRVSTRPDAVDGERLRLLREYGVTVIELGAQSMDDDVLCMSRRGHTAEDVERACADIRRYPFTLIVQLMTGLPGDTREKSVLSARRVRALAPDAARIYPVVVVAGTALESMWHSGEYMPPALDEAIETAADMLCALAPVPVIRIGLNPTEELSGGAALAGAYHPALGEMVRSRLLLRRMLGIVESAPAGNIRLLFARQELPAAIGQKRENILRLRYMFPGRRIEVSRSDAVAPGEIGIEVTL